jgi:predicted nucleic acid-binding protein
VVPLLLAEPRTIVVERILDADRDMLVWWGTEVECVSAIARREREASLAAREVAVAFQELEAFAQGWDEAPPTDAVRRVAGRLLRVHPLRAADALQLAAAVTISEGHPATLDFVTLDDRLADAARREGFRIRPDAPR